MREVEDVSADAGAVLARAFEQRDRWTISSAQPLVGIFGNGMPETLVAAAGAVPVHLSLGFTDDEHPVASVIEPFVDDEVRTFLVRLMNGEFADYRGIIFSRDDAPALIAYQYATEWIRQGKPRGNTPPLFLWNLVHTDSAPVRAFNAVQAEKLFAFFASIGLARPDPAALQRAAADEGRRQAALGDLTAAVGVTVSGAHAMQWRNAGRFMQAAEHARLLTSALNQGAGTVSAGRRIALVGSPLACPRTYAVLETFGSIVCDLQPLGSVWPGPGNTSGDLETILSAAAADASCPRITPSAAHRSGIVKSILDARCDLVVCQLAQTDDTFGWEVPRLFAELAGHGITCVNLGFRDPEPPAAWLDRATSIIAQALEARP